MSNTAEKIEAILHCEYGGCELHEGQEWYFRNGDRLSLTESKDYLLKRMDCLKRDLMKLLTLRNSIDSCIDELELTGDLFQDVLGLEESLALIELVCEDYLESYTITDLDYPDFEDSSFEIKDSDLPF